ncbi:MAG TPA: transglutaminase-like domain-containing protein [Mycobacteriales bacterium]|jgi:regulator of sirC expression with transglutaminase-like and TPR domain|nr:transglutaminase-like domain-containing protein [Mycobacteriales bacterium]
MTARRRFADVVRDEPVDLTLACLLVGGEVDPDLDVEAALATLDALAAGARRHVPRGCPPQQAAEGLRVALGEVAGFAGSAGDYDDVRSSLLHEVVRRGRGLPITLSVLWVAVAHRLDVVAELVALPGHVVVAIGADRPVYVDPYAGGRLLPLPDLAGLVRAATGAPLRPEDLEPAASLDILLRLLTNVRALAARQDRALEWARTRLWAVELSLLLPRHPAGLRRERGELLVRLGDHLGGAAQLEAYADVVEGADTAGAEAARREARQARARLN